MTSAEIASGSSATWGDLFLYDAAEDKALGVPLTFRDGEDRGLIKNAEGVALNASGDIVFVITDDGDRFQLVLI